MSTVVGLAVTAVKATRLRAVDSVTLGPSGAEGNRRFYLIDKRGQMVNGKRVGALQSVVADLRDQHLALTFADGRVVEGRVSIGSPVQTQFFSLQRELPLVEGPWSEALSELAGQQLRLVDAGDAGAVDRGPDAGVTLISRGSLERLSNEGGVSSVDVRRFRMLIEVDGIAPHEEDEWIGREVRIGDALVAFGGNVGRCMVTTRNPESGRVDLKTLHLLESYRSDVETTEPLPFGIYGSVLEGGTVRIGDRVTVQ